MKHYSRAQKQDLIDQACKETRIIVRGKSRKQDQIGRVGISGSGLPFAQVWSPDLPGINVEWAWETVEYILNTSKQFIIG